MVWDTLIPTLVGGAISAVTAVCMFFVAKQDEHRRREKEVRIEAATNAYVGFSKLLATANSIENLARHIDSQFEEANEQVRSVPDTAALIKPIIGARAKIEFLSATETAFLLKKNAELLSRIWEIQQRAESNDRVLETYNDLRTNFDSFLEERATDLSDLEGSVLSAKLQGRDGKVAKLRLAKLNTTIVPLIDALEEDRVTVKTVVNDYLDAARAYFGDDFPAKKIEWKDKRTC